jgi:hypothetical protein
LAPWAAERRREAKNAAKAAIPRARTAKRRSTSLIVKRGRKFFGSWVSYLVEGHSGPASRSY